MANRRKIGRKSIESSGSKISHPLRPAVVQLIRENQYNQEGCGSGGTGRRARLRILWGNTRGGSSPLSRTNAQHCLCRRESKCVQESMVEILRGAEPRAPQNDNRSLGWVDCGQNPLNSIPGFEFWPSLLQWLFEIVADENVVVFPTHAERRLVTRADVNAAAPILGILQAPLQ